MDRMQGSMGTLSAMQLTTDTAGLDAECKMLLHRKEVISVILKGTVEEFEEYSLEEIMDFIEADSLERTKEISVNRTNAQVRGDNAEFAQLNEKVSFFDLLLRAKNPVLSEDGMMSGDSMRVDLHIDIESQKTYRPGYPIEKRGLYYLARLLPAQLSLVTEQTDYRGLEKCCIWICRDEGYRLLRFLNAIMYPHEEDFMDTISEYINFSANEELWKETNGMSA